MNNQPKLERSLEMLMLLSGNRNYSVNELANKYELSERTIHRYISTFREAGFVIDQHDGLYRIVKMDKAFRKISDLLHFSEEEAWMLTKAIHAISDNNILKTNLINKLYSLYDFDRVADTVIQAENSEKVHRLMKAIKGQKQVVLKNYRSANSNIERNRLIEPFDFTTNYISIWAFDPESQKNKLFKLARIGEVELVDVIWQNKDKHKKLPSDVFRISHQKQVAVKLKLSMRAYSLLIEEYPLAEQYCLKEGNNTWTFESYVCGFTGVGRFVMGLPYEVKIESPGSFRKYIKEKAKVFYNNDTN